MLAKVITHTPLHITVTGRRMGGRGASRRRERDTGEIKVCLRKRMGEEGESGGTVIGCMQIYTGGFGKDARLGRDRERERESESGSQKHT